VKPSRNLLFLPALFLLSFFLLFPSYGWAQGESSPARPSLKKFMFNFQILLSELEMLKGETPTDWGMVREKVRGLRQNLTALENAEGNAGYGPSLEVLTSSMGKMEQLSRKKDPLLFSVIPSMKEKCFQCHSAHHVLGITERKN
jgi:hypothetical protein